MNVAFFLIPKSHVAYLTEGCSFRHGMDKLRRHGYTAIPVVARDGRYLGSVNEGDFLWNIMSMGSLDLNELEAEKTLSCVLHYADIGGDTNGKSRGNVNTDVLVRECICQVYRD